MTGLEQARARLGARQHDVLVALAAGLVPDGFDPRTTASAGAQLRGKRRHEAFLARPRLGGLPGGAELFDDYARRSPHPGCARVDADAFGRWLEGAELPAATATWIAGFRPRRRGWGATMAARRRTGRPTTDGV